MSLNAFVKQCFEMQQRDLLARIDGLTQPELEWKPVPHANSIGFLVWHCARVEDGWVQRIFQGKKHLWVTEGWAQRLGMAEDQRDMGYAYSQEQLDAYKVPPLADLLGYEGAVRDATNAFLDSWPGEADTTELKAPWGATVHVRDIFAQLIWELNQHTGQIAYIRGVQQGLQTPDYMGPLAAAAQA